MQKLARLTKDCRCLHGLLRMMVEVVERKTEAEMEFEGFRWRRMVFGIVDTAWDAQG
jgi:hypothetical protein